jgi:Zn-dependent protease with chaperone function
MSNAGLPWMERTAYRYPNEHLILAVTALLVFVVIAVSAAATFCASFLFVLAFVLLSYYFSRANHQALLRQAQKITPERSPRLARLVQQGLSRLRPGPVDVFIVPSKQINAYTFGLGSPKVVVLYQSLFQVMDEDEISFILGHELGHVALGHTWLNSLIGGMAGIPASFSAVILLNAAFLWWNRTCEFSADRAGLLACGSLAKAVSALVKLDAPEATTKAELAAAYRRLDAQDDDVANNLSEILATHPMLIKRITALRRYAGSSQYQRLQARLPGV